MGTHPIFESDFDCLTVPVSNQRISLDRQLVRVEIVRKG